MTYRKSCDISTYGECEKKKIAIKINNYFIGKCEGYNKSVAFLINRMLR